jgi:TRAP-type C4-dicarboxylate transport system substrate-binding protein
MKKIISKTRILWCTLFVLVFCHLSSALAAEYSMKIGSATSTRFAASGVMALVKEALEQGTYGQIKVEIYPAGQLGGEKVLIEKTISGDIQATPSSAPVAMTLNPKMGVVALPFVLNTREKLDKFYRSDLGKEMMNCLADKGLLGFDYIPWGPCAYLTTKPISKFDDVKKIRFRVTDSPIWLDTFRALGVSPVIIPFPDAYSSLQRGVTEGADNPPETLEAAKFYEVAKYYTQVTPFFSQTVFFVNAKWFNALPPDLRRIMVDVIKQCSALARVIEEYHQDRALNMMVKDHGVKVMNLPPEELEKFRQATKSVVTKYMKEIGEPYVRKVFDLAGYKY